MPGCACPLRFDGRRWSDDPRDHLLHKPAGKDRVSGGREVTIEPVEELHVTGIRPGKGVECRNPVESSARGEHLQMSIVQVHVDGGIAPRLPQIQELKLLRNREDASGQLNDRKLVSRRGLLPEVPRPHQLRKSR